MVTTNLPHGGSGRNPDPSPADLFSKAFDPKSGLSRALDVGLANVPKIGPADPPAPDLVATVARCAVAHGGSREWQTDQVYEALQQWSPSDGEGWCRLAIKAVDAARVASFKRAHGPRAVPEPVVQGWVREGLPCVIGGPLKSMKTTAAGQLVASLASGTPFMGMVVPDAVPVAVLTLETPAVEFGAKVAHTLATRDQRAAVRNVHVFGDRKLIATKQGRREFADFIDAAGVKVVVLDPAYLMLPRKVNTADVASFGRGLRWLVKPIVEAGATPVVVHHFTKDIRPGELPDLSDLSGAGMGPFADSWLLLNRESEYRGGGVHDLLTLVGSRGNNYARPRVRLDENAGTLTATSGERADAVRRGGLKVPGYRDGQKGG